MQPETWERTQKLFFQAADLSPREQARFLDAMCGANDELRREVESLLAADRKNGQGVVAAVESAAALLFDPDALTPRGDSQDLAGQRLGPYRVVREIGRGGMGAVYLATRDDDQYRKQVAIKVVKRGMDSAEVLGRFRHERQILANLDHPFIARLLDAGTTSDGRPFLVMDYVEGVPVDVFCRQLALRVKDRLLLFVRISEAVSHAHRNLVVHRDLKPGNIFVTADGSPRLLDFGVAKLFSPEADRGSATATMLGLAFTPEYASPEQVRGLPVTTAADVYALGLILYELLTGGRAQPLRTVTPIEIDRVVCESSVKKPSLLAHGLDTDLDYIVLMAIRKEPDRRYPSVDAMAEDIRRHLDGRPVIAREGSFRYHASKFIRRNRASIAAGILFAAVLIGGTTVATIQARRAERAQALAEVQRGRAQVSQHAAEQAALDAQAQRAIADTQRANAEAERKQAEAARSLADIERQTADRRFEQVRELAGKFLLDFHDSIATLPGSTPARKMVVQTGLQYYDTLVREATGNRSLLEEIARGYDRLGDVQGNPYQANLGDSTGAMASYQKALAIRGTIEDPSPEYLHDRMGGKVRVARMLAQKGDVAAAGKMLRDVITLGEQPPLSSARVVREALAQAYNDLSAMQARTGTYEKAIEPSLKMLALWTDMARENLDHAAEQTGVSLAHTRLGDALLRLARYNESLPHVRTAAAIDKELLAAEPNSAPRLHKYYIDQSLLWLIFRNRPAMAAAGEPRQAAETAAEMADRILAADPNNNAAFFDVMSAQTLVGDWFRDHGQAEESIPYYRKALDAGLRFAATRPGELLSFDTLAYAHQRLAAGLGNAGHLEQALEECRKADTELDQAEARTPDTLQVGSRRANVASARADAYAHNKMWQPAVDAYKTSIALFEDLIRRDSKSSVYDDELIDLHSHIADCYAALERWSDAAENLEKVLNGLEAAALRRALSPSEQELRQAGPAKLELWKRRALAVR
ncbi:MAG TPA: protein kinase [Bryobacteraceae bacterium]|nr:protein kinase [Bryobacteraceae bacterium]